LIIQVEYKAKDLENLTKSEMKDLIKRMNMIFLRNNLNRNSIANAAGIPLLYHLYFLFCKSIRNDVFVSLGRVCSISLLFVLLFCSGNTYAQTSLPTQSNGEDSTVVLNIDSCISIGLRNATAVLKGQNALKLTGVQLFAAYGQFLPDLSFGANYTFNGGKDLYVTTVPTLVNGRENILNYQLISTINIFNGLYDISTLKAAALSKSAAQLNLTRVQQQISYDIAQGYLQVILDRRVVEYAKQNLQTSTDREEQLKGLTDVGRKALSDLYQQQAETSSDKLFLIQSIDKVQDDQVLLLRKMRIGNPDKYTIADEVRDTFPLGPDYRNADQMVAKALSQRPDYESLEKSIKIADWNIKQYRSGYLPKVTLDFGLESSGGYADQIYIDGINQFNTYPQEPLGNALFGQVYGTVGIGVAWRIFDKFLTKTNVDAARIYRSNAELDRDDLAVQISADVRQAFNDYVAALQQIETSRTGVVAAQQAFEVIQERYNVGSSTFIDLSNAQAVLLQAEVNRAQAVIKLSLQRKIFDYLLGGAI
jgi:outer membrane protein